MERNRIKFEFLVHDLKVPLAVIEAGLLSLLTKQDKYGPLTDKQLKVLERALRNTVITRTLVNDTLEIGRSSQGLISRTRFSLSAFLLDTLVEILDLNDHEVAEKVKQSPTLPEFKNNIAQRGIYLELEDALWQKELFLDESKSKQILRNLLTNALKYRKSRVDLRIAMGGNCLQIAVRDDGEGIPADYHQRIFECYFQMDARNNTCVRGHGLGLAGVQVLLEDMGGELTLDSDVGRGATFLVRIPF
jgi:two-component system, OmpR family, sensor kinase